MIAPGGQTDEVGRGRQGAGIAARQEYDPLGEPQAPALPAPAAGSDPRHQEPEGERAQPGAGLEQER